MSDLRKWLKAIGLGQYAELFADNGIDFDVLPDLNEHDLEQLGVSIGHRKRLLRATAKLRSAARTSESPIEIQQIAGSKAERRHLTVLFCDIVGSTALSAQLDPEDLQQVLREYQRCCDVAVRRYGGYVSRFMGDGVLAYFGFPAAHEDDAERAVNAAFEIVGSVSALTSSTYRLEIRIGIATGLVVVGDLIGEGPAQEFALAGETANLAARLQQLAGPNQILVSSHTRQLLGGLFEVTDLGDRQIKGFDDEVHVWRVARPSPGTSRFEAHRSSQLTPLVGRERELALLEENYKKAEHGSGQLVTISGEAGIGKSRLIVALRDHLNGTAYCPPAFQCSSYHTSSPWYPIVRYLEDAADIAFDTPPTLRLERLAALVDRHLPEQSESVTPLLAALMSIPTGDRYEPLELTPQQQKNRTCAAIINLLQARSDGQPVVLVFEDVHWIDPTSLQLLEWISDRVQGWQMLVILLFRSNFSLPWNNWQHVTSLTIDRLDTAQVTSMVEWLIDDKPLLRFAEEIVAKTDGVPLFIEEMTKAMIESGLKTDQQADSYPKSTFEVPVTLHDSLMARLHQSASMKTVAQIAAALGREFSFDLLSAISPLTDLDLRSALDRLIASGLLFKGDQAGRETYVFKHALIQDAAYGSILRAERQQLHAKIADVLCRRFSELAEAAPELVAHHFTQAHELEPAIVYWIKAGQQASKRSAFVETTRHLKIALELLAKGPGTLKRDEMELQLQHSLGSAFIAAKGFGARETAQAFKRALDLCDVVEGSPHTFAVLNGMFGVHLMQAQFEQSRDVANALLARALGQDDPTPLLMGHRALGMSLFMIGELTDARRELRKAIELYDPSHHASLALVFSQDFKATAQAYLSLASVIQGDVQDGIANGEQAVAYAESLRHPHTICYVLPFLAGSYVIARTPQAAYRTAERAIALSNEYGFPLWAAGGLLLRGWARLELEEVEQGLSDVRRSLDALNATGTLVWAQFARFLMAQAFAKAGDKESALSYLKEVFADLGSGRWYEAESCRLKGELLFARGDLEAAKASLERAITVAEYQQARTWKARATCSLASCLRSINKSSHAAAG
jgi:class 3 adenylate cyclase/tetratricopeptide (TPR) repeat protein